MQKQTQTEFTPALERPLDKASIDTRMKDQLDFESHMSRFNPRNFDVSDKSAESPKSEGRSKKAAKRVLALAGVAAVSVGIGKAIPNTGSVEPKSDTIGITTIANGHLAEINIATENATQAQKRAQIVNDNNGQFPDTP